MHGTSRPPGYSRVPFLQGVSLIFNLAPVFFPACVFIACIRSVHREGTHNINLCCQNLVCHVGDDPTSNAFQANAKPPQLKAQIHLRRCHYLLNNAFHQERQGGSYMSAILSRVFGNRTRQHYFYI